MNYSIQENIENIKSTFCFELNLNSDEAVLFVCLLAFMACDIVDILKCVYETPIVQEIIKMK